MKIWITDAIGYLDGYSLFEQPEMIGITARKEPVDYYNWRWDGEKLCRDIKNAPQPEPEAPTEIELLQQKNIELEELVSELTDAVLFISESMGGTE